ncbi:hypothetical protein F4680DRAFT_166297 [Xylaria scruposa]|nr:hypothetical protein F4680DRAFT_166297 [Xylaria scruposa]
MMINGSSNERCVGALLLRLVSLQSSARLLLSIRTALETWPRYSEKGKYHEEPLYDIVAPRVKSAFLRFVRLWVNTIVRDYT